MRRRPLNYKVERNDLFRTGKVNFDMVFTPEVDLNPRRLFLGMNTNFQKMHILGIKKPGASIFGKRGQINWLTVACKCRKKF